MADVPDYELVPIRTVTDTGVRFVRLLKSFVDRRVTVVDDLDTLDRELPSAWRKITGSAYLFVQALPGCPPNTSRYHGFGPGDWNGRYANCYLFKDGGERFRMSGFILKGERFKPDKSRERVELVVGVALRQAKKSGGKGGRGQRSDTTVLDFVNEIFTTPGVARLASDFMRKVTT